MKQNVLKAAQKCKTLEVTSQDYVNDVMDVYPSSHSKHEFKSERILINRKYGLKENALNFLNHSSAITRKRCS